MECPVCKKDFNPHTGRRPKKFCSDECKIKFWNGQKKVVEIIQKAEEKEFAETHHAVMETATTTKGIFAAVDTMNKIKELEEEYSILPDVGLGKKRKAFLQGQINKLKMGLTK